MFATWTTLISLPVDSEPKTCPALSGENGPRLGHLGLWFPQLFSLSIWFYCLLFFCKHFIYFLSERGEGREKEEERNLWEKHRSVASRTPPSRDLAHNPGTCPDWEPNSRPFNSQSRAQSTEPHQPVPLLTIFWNSYFRKYFSVWLMWVPELFPPGYSRSSSFSLHWCVTPPLKKITWSFKHRVSFWVSLFHSSVCLVWARTTHVIFVVLFYYLTQLVSPSLSF